jgi:transcriptional regulator with XRE-family HTH domain
MHDQRGATIMDRLIGKRVRERRLEIGMSQEGLATLLGVTFQQVQKYEKGVNRVAASRLYDIAKALDVEIGYFFERGPTAQAPLRRRPAQRPKD